MIEHYLNGKIIVGNTSFPKKYYYGKKRSVVNKYGSHRRKILKWAITIRPGDYIATCQGYNSKVISIEYFWRDYRVSETGKVCKLRRGRMLYEVCFKVTGGLFHYAPGGGCAGPKETNEQIIAFHVDNGYGVPKLNEFGERVD